MESHTHARQERRRQQAQFLRPSPYDRLTDNVITQIFSYLSTKQLCRCSCVNRRWNRLAWQPLLWTKVRLSGRRTDVDSILNMILKRLSRETPYVCLSVVRLILNDCQMLTDRGLELVAQHCPELRHVELIGCYQISNAAIFEIVSRCSNLDYLDISGNVFFNHSNLTSFLTVHVCNSSRLSQTSKFTFWF